MGVLPVLTDQNASARQLQFALVLLDHIQNIHLSREVGSTSLSACCRGQCKLAVLGGGNLTGKREGPEEQEQGGPEQGETTASTETGGKEKASGESREIEFMYPYSIGGSAT